MPRIMILPVTCRTRGERRWWELDLPLPNSKWPIVSQARRSSPAQLLRSQWRNLSRNGWRWAFYQAGEIVRELLLRITKPREQASAAAPGLAREFRHAEGKVAIDRPKMTWNDLRQMRSDGFIIGSHIVNHSNCVKKPVEVVQRELRDSLDQLRNQSNLRDVILAYPFGGREHLTPERLELVKQGEYVGCLSAYGGFNRGSIDRYNILRGGMNWGYSDLAFRCRIAGIV